MTAITRMSRKVAQAFLACSCLVGSVSAANLYQEGTTPYRMFKVIEPIVGDLVTPVFILGDDPMRFLHNINPKALHLARVKEPTLRYYLSNLKPESKAYGITGYALGGYGVPGNEKRNETCAIVVASDDRMKTTSTMFHEAIHCKNFAELRAAPAAWKLAASLNDPSLGVTHNQFMSLFHEVLAAYMQVAYSSNQGIKDGLGMVMGAAEQERNTATSIGYRTARSALALCAKKDACPTNAVDMVNMLSADQALKADFTKDIQELYLAARATGFVVEDK